MGIDTLPGGFAPYLLAPSRAIIEVPDSLSLKCAALTEPFAAAVQAVDATPPHPKDKVAILGPRRLGLSIIAALSCYRHQQKLLGKPNADFEIIAIGNKICIYSNFLI